MLWPACGLLAACAPARSPVLAPPPEVVAADSSLRAAIANERAIDASSFPARTVAVAPFQVISSDTSLAVLGFGLADLLMTDLSRSAQLHVVDRLRLDALVREMGLVTAGVVDSSSAPRFGKLVGARQLVMGSLTTMRPESARLDGRIGNVVTGQVLATNITPTSLDAILDAEKALAFAVFNRLGVTLSPAERVLVEQRPTKSLAALLAYSRGVRAQVMGDYRRAGLYYREALQVDVSFNMARSQLDHVDSHAGPAIAIGPPPADLLRVGFLALEGVNASTLPKLATAADPSFRQPLSAIIIITLNLP